MRIGLYRGNFSPIHQGHLAAVKACMEQMWLDVLYVLPSAAAPGDANAWQRMKMCELAFEGTDGVLISDYEVRRGDQSSLVDTLRAFSSDEHRLFLLMGTDDLLGLGEQPDVAEIFALSYPVYMRREGSDPILDARIVAKISEYQQRYGKVVRRIVGDAVVASGKTIRAALAAGQRVSHILTPAVENYIRENGLYKTQGGVAK
jgi:nicotinate-nucleotide adenylyltransferase